MTPAVVYTQADAPTRPTFRRVWLLLVPRLEFFRLWWDATAGGFHVEADGNEIQLGHTWGQVRPVILDRWKIRQSLPAAAPQRSGRRRADTLEVLGPDWKTTNEVGKALAISTQAALQRLKKLRAAGLVESSSGPRRGFGRPHSLWRRAPASERP